MSKHGMIGPKRQHAQELKEMTWIVFVVQVYFRVCVQGWVHFCFPRAHVVDERFLCPDCFNLCVLFLCCTQFSDVEFLPLRYPTPPWEKEVLFFVFRARFRLQESLGL